jgi:chromosomal replication initiation ATPase DnaA
MNQEEDITKMLIEVGETAKIVGVSSLTKMLKEIQKTKKDLSQQEYEKAMDIISVVCDVYEMTVSDFFSNKRKNNRRFALGSVCYILNKENNFDYQKISFITKKSFTYISILINEIKEMDIMHPFEKKILQKLEIIKLKLQNN